MLSKRITPLRACVQCGAPITTGTRKFCTRECHTTWLRASERVSERFWSKVDRNGPIPEYAPTLGPCWLWIGGIGSHGYGGFKDGPRDLSAHVWAYEKSNGPVAKGLELDHLCRVRRCVRPAHLEPVERRVNQRRGMSPYGKKFRQTHCIHGHVFDHANTIHWKDGTRRCRACAKRHGDERRARNIQTPPLEKQCEYCKALYRTYKPKQRFCNNSCGSKHQHAASRIASLAP